MIHFDFTVSDEDAENILGFVEDARSDALLEVMKSIASKGEDHPETKCLRRYAEYCKKLKSKIKYERIGDETTT